MPSAHDATLTVRLRDRSHTVVSHERIGSCAVWAFIKKIKSKNDGKRWGGKKAREGNTIKRLLVWPQTFFPRRAQSLNPIPIRLSILSCFELVGVDAAYYCFLFFSLSLGRFSVSAHLAKEKGPNRPSAFGRFDEANKNTDKPKRATTATTRRAQFVIGQPRFVFAAQT